MKRLPPFLFVMLALGYVDAYLSDATSLDSSGRL